MWKHWEIEQTKHKASIKKGIIKIGTKIKKIIEERWRKIRDQKLIFLGKKKHIKNNNLLAGLIKEKKREKIQMTIIRSERGNITTDHTEIKD